MRPESLQPAPQDSHASRRARSAVEPAPPAPRHSQEHPAAAFQRLAGAPLESSRPDDVLKLQRLVGNRQMRQLLEGPHIPQAASPGGLDADGVRQMAERGTSGPVGAFPHVDAIQASFGRHDIRHVPAHIGGPATAAAQRMGAEAFAAFDRAAFAGPPSLHTAAHEAAHVIQQRAGIRADGGMGSPDDPHERHADAVADRVVQGSSSESLLDAYPPSPGRSFPGAVIQPKLVVGGAVIRPDAVQFELQRLVRELGRDSKNEMSEHDRLKWEAESDKPYVYAGWIKAVQGIPIPAQAPQAPQQPPQAPQAPQGATAAPPPSATAAPPTGATSAGPAGALDAKHSTAPKQGAQSGAAPAHGPSSLGSSSAHVPKGAPAAPPKGGLAPKGPSAPKQAGPSAALAAHSPSSLGSLSVAKGSIVFTNVAETHQARAQLILDVLSAHKGISTFIGGRPCFITLVQSGDNPASVVDLGKQINIELADWYFEKYELGYILGMLAHEFAIHPMASKAEGVAEAEYWFKGIDLSVGVDNDDGKPLRVNTNQAHQPDHILGALFGQHRNRIYRDVVLEFATLLATESSKKDSGIQPDEATRVIDCFLMDCASILANNDSRIKGLITPSLIAKIYNDYLTKLKAVVTDKAVLKLFPPVKEGFQVFSGYMELIGRLASLSSGSSRDQITYQPTPQQQRALETQGLRLHWVEPDGRCVFGALAHAGGMKTEQAIDSVLTLLEAGGAGVTGMITGAGQTVAAVIDCIRKGRWADPKVGDIILEVAATCLGLGVTVLLPDGRTWDVNGGGHVIVRVLRPLEHYHSTAS